jgi:2,3-diaminopropionate biosynthesis protein SbnA
MDNNILTQVGHTPLILLEKTSRQLSLQLYGKLEMLNPGGSIKDRPALLMLTKALESGQLEKGGTVIESSSGNMAIGLAQACRYLELSVVVVVDPKINKHTLKILQAYGARIEQVTRADEDGNYLNRRLERVQELVDRIPGGFWPNQYGSKYNPAAHYQTMDEIVSALPTPPDYLLAATSTCGTIMGCAKYVRQHNLPTKLIAVDAAGSVIFGASPANRLVPGHGAGRPSDLLDREAIDRVIHITDRECVLGCRSLLSQEAILAGGSSGAVRVAARKLRADLPSDVTCALILPDSGERYLDTIYNDEWVEEHFEAIKEESGEARAAISLSVNGSDSTKKTAGKAGGQDTQKIAIIGGGPKGTYGFERLAAQFKAHPPKGKVEIHVYNRSPYFGAGDTYRPDQPSYLVINNPVGDINMWTGESPPGVAENPLPATEWLQQEKTPIVGPEDYVPRAMVGAYLQAGFHAIANRLPAGVSGSYIVGEVSGITKEGERYALRITTPGGHTQHIPHHYDHLLFATGHPQSRQVPPNPPLAEQLASPTGATVVPYIYPVDKKLSAIKSGEKVAIKGMGLTFIDAVLALTEGRGGGFARESFGRLSYHPSGQEPQVMYPFSRHGWPMIPRTPPPAAQEDLSFFTGPALDNLRKQQPGGKLDFKTHIWSLLEQEMLVAFYHRQMINEGVKDDLSACATFPEVQHYIEGYHRNYPNEERFHPKSFLKPWQYEACREGQSFTSYIQSYLTFYIEEAQKREEQSPWAAVSGVWRRATPIFGEYYQFGGLTPGSQQYVDHTVRPLLNRVTFGPPVGNAKKLVALIRAGLLDFSVARNPTLQMDKQQQQCTLTGSHSDYTVGINGIIDARIPKVSITGQQDALYNTMLDQQLISPFQNTGPEHSYAPGSLAMTAEGFTIDGQGHVNEAIAVTGTPTEGVTFDNDTLSRSRNNTVSAWAASVRKKCSLSITAPHES